MNLLLLRTLCLFLLVCCFAKGAAAASGTITGNQKFTNTQGNYCDTSLGVSCTGSLYPASQFNTARGVKNAKIEVWRQHSTTGARLGTQPIGSGYTDLAGNYSVTWSYTSTPLVRIDLVLCHKDSRFCVVDPANPLPWIVVLHSSVTPTNGGTKAVGSWTLNALGVLNIYDAAAFVWENALRFSGAIQTVFTNVKLYYPDPNMGPGDAVAVQTTKSIYLASDMHNQPMNGVAHEMGHMAVALLKPFKWCGIGGNGSIVTDDALCTAFEEGIASFYGAKSFFNFTATQPIYCFGSGACGDDGAETTPNLERSSGNSNCGTKKNWQLTTSRFIWDVYDQPNDAGWSDTLSWAMWYIGDSLAAWSTGTSNSDHGNNEPWNSGLSTVDDEDGRSGLDFRFYVDNSVDNASAQYEYNCSPGAD